MAELLFEVMSEEIPARMQRRALEDFTRLVTDGLAEAGLTHGRVQGYVGPRRIALAVDDLPTAQPDRTVEKKGPKVGAPEKALEGFLASIGATLDRCEQRETPKGPVWFYAATQPGRPTAAVLVDVLGAALGKLSWPKSMRWGAWDARWVRPMTSLLCRFDGQVVPVAFHHLTAGGVTHGHRVMGQRDLNVVSFCDYRDSLAANGVIIDAAERVASILDQAHRLAAAAGLVLADDPGLLAEVAGLVEWPVVLLGKIDDAFMDVPAEVLTATMRTNQKYFRLDTPDGAMAPNFLVVANQAADDGGTAIMAGNERVLRARLSDAKFFWDNDLKVSLEDRLPDLDRVVFHEKLGSVGDRAKRLSVLARDLGHAIPDCDPDLAARAGALAKADLVSEMVFEFPEVQGVMGGYYADRAGKDPAIGAAIAQHYSPAGPSDTVPTQPVAVAVALADKLDVLAGFWAIEEKPTGSKDPFALRRAALGIIRLVLENDLRLGLKSPLSRAFKYLGETLGWDDDQLSQAIHAHVPDLLAFFADRMKVYLRDRGVRHDLIQAVFNLGDQEYLDLIVLRARALQSFLAADDGANLLAAYRRASNILKIEEKKDARSYRREKADGALLEHDAERALKDALDPVFRAMMASVEKTDFEGAMTALAALRAPVDTFFEDVMVNVENPQVRENRLKLLAEIRDVMHAVADFGAIEG